MGEVSNEAVINATGQSIEHWFAIFDSFPPGLNHTELVREFAKHPARGDVSDWWCQGLTVEWEKARGLRVEGQSCDGDFQVSCSKTVALDPQSAFARVVETPFLAGADWTVGATWESEDARIEVRRADPGKMLRWFWHDADGKSTVEVMFDAKAAGTKTAIIFRHHQLASSEARDKYRARWKTALNQIISG